MPPTYKQNKSHIYSYRDKNRAKYNEYQRILLTNNRNNPYFEYEKITRIFRKILF
jgi:hypothetical protein